MLQYCKNIEGSVQDESLKCKMSLLNTAVISFPLPTDGMGFDTTALILCLVLSWLLNFLLLKKVYWKNIVACVY